MCCICMEKERKRADDDRAKEAVQCYRIVNNSSADFSFWVLCLQCKELKKKEREMERENEDGCNRPNQRKPTSRCIHNVNLLYRIRGCWKSENSSNRNDGGGRSNQSLPFNC